MSAQALNGSSYSGYVGSGTVGSVPTRDASDITRQLKERLIYNGFNSGTTIVPGTANKLSSVPILNPAGVNHVPGNSEWSWLPYGNQFRLSYFFGKMKNTGAIPTGTVTGSSNSWTFATTTDLRTLGFKTGGYATVAAASTGGYSVANVGSFPIASVGATSITLTYSGGTAESKVGSISLCAGGLFNTNGPKLPGSSTSLGS